MNTVARRRCLTVGGGSPVPPVSVGGHLRNPVSGRAPPDVLDQGCLYIANVTWLIGLGIICSA